MHAYQNIGIDLGGSTEFQVDHGSVQFACPDHLLIGRHLPLSAGDPRSRVRKARQIWNRRRELSCDEVPCGLYPVGILLLLPLCARQYPIQKSIQ